ncbi:MAG: fatty acid desaturase [Leptolyngbyaceae bacterium]|nr:fatty acid desaturase [Leptolyngbyaceae bacterium]
METSSTSPLTVNYDLRASIADLESVNPWVGLWRFVLLGTLCLSFGILAWLSPNLFLFLSYTAIAGVIYAFWLVCTHDAAHHTLTGWQWFDEGMSRLISYPMLWPYGTYVQLHRLHHAWNGIDLRDPERVQWTMSEYQQAQPWQQWYVRHQWIIDIFGLGGFGLIAKMVSNGMRFRPLLPALQRSLLIDGLGIFVIQTSFAMIAILQGRFGHYLLFWLVLERVIGIIVQVRDHLEHYGLWNTQNGHRLTQLYACRNLNTSTWVAWLMGGLNDHAVHHAFPKIPFNHLSIAFHRIQGVLERHQLPTMSRGNGYIREALHLSSQPLFISGTVE